MLIFKLFCIKIMTNSLVMGEEFHPSIDDEWWGSPQGTLQNNTEIRPFYIEFSTEIIDDLRYRLNNHRPFTRPLFGTSFNYGFNTDYLNSWIDYWANKYDFKHQENVLNQYPQYKTNIQGLDIHFLWVKPDAPPNIDVIPLLLLHGFPGSVVEFFKAIPLLTAVSKDRDFAVELIVPSLPGFGFSDGAVRPGFGAPEMGIVIRNLMQRLGFKKYYIQGGDWGAGIGTTIATLYPEETLGYHTNFPLSLSVKTLGLWIIGAKYPSLVMDNEVINRTYPIFEHLEVFLQESGYFHLQATKPDTLGIALSDSPSGLLAYVLQLISSGSRRKYVNRADGGLEDLFTRDELLNNLMFYWVPNSFTTASRIYIVINLFLFAESANKNKLITKLFAKPTPVPTWTIHAKDEIIYQSPLMLKDKYTNLLHSTILQDGGHFLAFEAPIIFAEDVLKALSEFRRWNEKNRNQILKCL